MPKKSFDVIDADAHVEEWAETFSDKYLDEKFRSRRPEVITGGQRPYWLIEDSVMPKFFGRGCYFLGTPTGYGTTLNPIAGTKPEAFESQEVRDVSARLKELDREGIDIQVLYPTLFVVAYSLTSDPQFEVALYRSYNNWMEDVTKGEKRLQWVAVVTLTDVVAAVEEVRRAKKLGAVGVMTLGTVRDQTLDEPQFDPFYRALVEEQLPLAVHVGWSSPKLNHFATFNFVSVAFPFRGPVQMALINMIAGGVFDRHPKLKVGFFEAGLGWVPYWIEIMDEIYEVKHRKPGVPVLEYRASQKPSEYLRSGSIFFSTEEIERLFYPALELIGEDHVFWASDIPHSDRDPKALQHFMEAENLTEKQKRKMLFENAKRFYNL